ncbi:MAG: SHOCT domain-containing protein [Nitrolancea sp.]
MTQTTWIIAEVFVGIAMLTILTAFVTHWFGPPSKRGPAEILKERYARGEISRSEYREMAEDLGVEVHYEIEEPYRSEERDTDSSTKSHA